MLPSGTQLGFNQVYCIGQPCNVPSGRCINATDGEEVLLLGSQQLLSSGSSRKEPRHIRLGQVFSISFFTVQCLDPKSIHLCVPSPSQGSPLTLAMLPLSQIHSLQFHLLSFPPFPYSTAQKYVKASFPYLISNVRSLCFNEPRLNPPEDGFWQEQSPNYRPVEISTMRKQYFPSTVTILPFSSSLF